jgi:hypothetical protein
VKIAARIILALLVVAGAYWLWGVLFPNPEQVVRKRLSEAAQAASFAPGQGYISKLAGAQRFADFFATNAEASIDAGGQEQHHLSGREEIFQAALSARAALNNLTVSFPNVSIEVAPDKETATADLTAEAKTSGASDMFIEEMKFTFRRFGRDWLITRVETVQTLQRGGP